MSEEDYKDFEEWFNQNVKPDIGKELSELTFVQKYNFYKSLEYSTHQLRKATKQILQAFQNIASSNPSS